MIDQKSMSIMISPTFYNAINISIKLHNLGIKETIINLSIYDRLFIAFWIVVSLRIFIYFLKQEYKKWLIAQKNNKKNI
jgi:hypothetical protein